MPVFQRTTGILIGKFEQFIDTVAEGLLVFRHGAGSYLDNDAESFHRHLSEIDRLEKSADNLQREIESDMILHSILPKHRVEVFQLIDRTDEILDTAKRSLNEFYIERPFIPDDLRPSIRKLVDTSFSAADKLIPAIRIFFTNPHLTRDKLVKVYFYEKETDQLSSDIKREIFHNRDDLELAGKAHLRYIIHHIESVSDRSQDVADLLTGLAMRMVM